MADFGKLAVEIKEWQESSAWCVLRDPRTDEPLGNPPARILLSSPLSERWQRLEKAYQAQLRLARENGQRHYTVDDVERFEEHRLQCYAAVTRDWENIDRDGAPLACSPVNMEWLYGMKWVAGQLLVFMSDLSNFGAPAETEPAVAVDVMGDAEKKFSTGASGTLQ